MVIKRATAKVFAYASDVRTFAEWGTGVLSSSQTSGDGPGVGASYMIKRKVGGRVFDVEITIAEYVPNQRLVLQGVTNGAPWTSEMDLEPIDEGTAVTESIHLNPSGLARLFSGLMAILVRRTHRRDLVGLRNRLELAGGFWALVAGVVVYGVVAVSLAISFLAARSTPGPRP